VAVAAASAAAAADPPVSAEEEAAFAAGLIQNLQGLADKAQKVTEAKGEEEFMAAMSDMHNNEAYTNEFLPFMQGLMGSLLSKDMMYPSLKEMTDKYPVWLEENGAGLPTEERERYQMQLGLMQDAVKEYDSETPADSDEAAAGRFERLIVIMQKMQLCGHPPEALVGQLPQGWGMTPDGLPQVIITSPVCLCSPTPNQLKPGTETPFSGDGSGGGGGELLSHVALPLPVRFPPRLPQPPSSSLA
jgi:peroxin-19